MSTRRPSLRDRNRAQMASAADRAVTTSPEPAPAQAVRAREQMDSPRRAADAPNAAAAGSEAAGESSTIKVGFTVPPQVLEDSRGAYVADLDDLDDPELSHARWIERALRAHVARSIATRQKVEAELPAAQGTPLKRAWFLRPDAVAAVDDAIATERAEGAEWRSRTAFAIAAMQVAIEAARDRRSGTLPQAPPRLPNRPTFRSRS